MNLAPEEEFVTSPTSAAMQQGSVPVVELVDQMKEVIKLLNEQKVCAFVSLVVTFLEYNHLHPSVWGVVPGNLCSIWILLQLRVVGTDFMDIVWSIVLLRCTVSS
jgi:hypothetical protein